MKKTELQSIAHFIYESGTLAKTPRSGLWLLGTGAQSVAEHSLRAAYIGYALSHLTPKADKERVVLLCLFHDIGGLAERAEREQLHRVVGVGLDLFLELLGELALDLFERLLECVAPGVGAGARSAQHDSECTDPADRSAEQFGHRRHPSIVGNRGLEMRIRPPPVRGTGGERRQRVSRVNRLIS